MFEQNDSDWLSKYHPGLAISVEGNEIVGTLRFEAGYNEANDRFIIIDNLVGNDINGTILKGDFNVRIEKKSRDQLPVLYLDRKQVEFLTDRHLHRITGAACLCGPVEEIQAVKSGIALPNYINHLVIPFLYGQVYYDQFNSWPWKEYGHGSVGVVESYANYNSDEFLEATITRLRTFDDWQTIKFLISQKRPIKGHISCICKRKDHFRRCHPHLWNALNLMREHVQRSGLPLN